MMDDNAVNDVETTCPVTDLPVISRPEWTDVAFDSDYRLTTRLIGKQIILNQPTGHGSLLGIQKSLDHIGRIIDRYLDVEKGYVHISDYSHMVGVSLKARRFYAAFMRKRKNMVGLIYFGTSPFFQLMIKMGNKLFTRNQINARIVSDYTAAVQLAVKMISSGKTHCDPVPLWVFSRKEKGREILSSHKWCLKNGDFSACFEVIDRSIFHPKTSGALEVEHIEPLTKLRQKIMDEVCRENGFDYIVADVTSTKSIGLRARRSFMASIKTWHYKNPIKAYVVYGATGLVRTAISIAKPFMPFKLMYAKDYDHALSLVEKDRRLKNGWLGFFKSRLFGGMGRQLKTPDDVKRLLEYIGDIDWEKDGIHSSIPVKNDHPFRQVFEAISLIKNELDEVFNEREKAQEALKESERRFNEVLEHSRDILFKRDVRTGRYAYISKAVSQLLGYSPKETKQMGYEGVKSLFHPDDLEKFNAFSQNLMESKDDKTDYIVEYRMKNKDGGYTWFSDSHSVIRDQNGNPRFVIGGNRDITAQKKAEAELKIAQERFINERLKIEAQLRRSQKVEAVATLAGGIAHNFNNLLMTVLGNLELARMNLPENPRLLNNINSSEAAAKKAAELSTLMLTYVGQTQVALQILDLNTVASEMAQVLKTSVAGSYTLAHHPTDQRLLFKGDAAKIGQVITNLVTNSVESGLSEPVHIVFKTGLQFCDTAMLDRLAPNENLEKGDYATLEVKDDGRGMEKEVAEKVFDPFFTTKFTGRGLGLAAVIGIMRAHHGGISINSQPGLGTAVTLFFPIEAADHRQHKKDASPGPVDAQWKGSGTVLLVDDETHIIEIGQAMLELLGFDVITASNGFEAIAHLKQNLNRTVLVILDLTMPRKDGFETFEEIKAIHPNVPVIISSGFAKHQVENRFTGEEPSGYLKKPFQYKGLSDKIKSVLSAEPNGKSEND